MFYRRLTSASLALSQIRQLRLYSLIALSNLYYYNRTPLTLGLYILIIYTSPLYI
jgi:hypothetical protein